MSRRAKHNVATSALAIALVVSSIVTACAFKRLREVQREDHQAIIELTDQVGALMEDALSKDLHSHH